MLFAYFDESMGSIVGYESWWSWNTVDKVLILNSNEFSTVPKGSDLLYYTNGSHKVFVKFCVDEVFEEWGVTDVRRMKRGKSSILGIPKAPQVNISSILKHLSLGMPRLPSHLSSSTIIGIPRFLFCSHDLCPLYFSFSLRTVLVWDRPSSIYGMLHVLHLYLLSMTL